MDLSLYCSLFFSAPPQRLFLVVSDVNGRAALPPPSADYSTYPPSLSLSRSASLFPALSFPCSLMYHSPLSLWLSLPLHISSGVLAIKCKPGSAVSPTHTEETQQHTPKTVITIFRGTGKLFHRLHFFTLFIFHGYFSVFVRIILVVGIKTETCQSLSSFFF